MVAKDRSDSLPEKAILTSFTMSPPKLCATNMIGDCLSSSVCLSMRILVRRSSAQDSRSAVEDVNT